MRDALTALNLSTVGDLCSLVKLDDQKPTVDLSNISFVEPFGLVYLGMFLRHFNSLGKYFNIISPQSRPVRQYLESQKFWHRYNIASNSTDSQRSMRHARLTSLSDIVDIENNQYIAEDVGDMVGDILRNNTVKVDASLVTEVAVELVDNFSRHSGQQLAACAVQLYRQRGDLHFAVGDCGVGIRSSLCMNPHYQHLDSAPHYKAAVKALEDGVTGSSEGGTGFGTVRRDVIQLGGQMILCTGDGWVIIGGGRQGVEAGRMPFDLPGVQIEIRIPVEGSR